MSFGEPHPFPERGSPTRLSESGQQSYEGRSCRLSSCSLVQLYIKLPYFNTPVCQSHWGPTMFRTLPDPTSCTLVTGSLSQAGVNGQNVRLITHPLLASRLKKKYSYISAPSLVFHGHFQCEFYLLL